MQLSVKPSAASKRSKADRDLATWMSPATGYRCQYVIDWAADKTRWGLTVDATERDALAEQLGQGIDTPITVVLAR